ncbi:MAG: response regulator [Ignavibacteriae bacterium]|nr:response regulator [Ignavibacteriota bacterium]
MPDKVSILVADDDNYLRSSLKSHLIDEGFDVMEASNGADAISLLRSKTFPLLILDLKMPEVNGMGVLKFVKTFSPSTKVIVLTSYADLAHGTAAAKEGADDFISKPYEVEDLIATVERLLLA